MEISPEDNLVYTSQILWHLFLNDYQQHPKNGYLCWEKRWHYFVRRCQKMLMHSKEQILTARPIRESSRPGIQWIERFARWMDSRFLIPGTSIRFGFDPILSLFPVLGDLVTYIISGALIHAMYQHGASRNVVIKMILNSTLDAVIGAIPLVGTIFDIFFRANDRNVKLLKEHYFEGKHQGSGTGLLVVIAIVSLVFVVGAIYGMYKLIDVLFNLFPESSATSLTVC